MKKKSIIILIILVIMIIGFSNKMVYSFSTDQVINDADNFLNRGKNDKIDYANLEKFSDTVYNTLLLFGMVIAVVGGIIIGIKLMVSSVDEKAKVKEILVAYVIGCFVLLGAFSIWKIVVVIMS